MRIDTTRQATRGEVQVGILYGPRLEQRSVRHMTGISWCLSYLKFGCDLYVLIASDPSRRKTQTLRSKLVTAHHTTQLPSKLTLHQQPRCCRGADLFQSRYKDQRGRWKELSSAISKYLLNKCLRYSRPTNSATAVKVPCSASNLSSNGVSARVLNKACQNPV